MFLLAVLSALVAVLTADPLPCCMPERFSGLLQEIGGAVGKNSTQSHVTDVGIDCLTTIAYFDKAFVDYWFCILA